MAMRQNDQHLAIPCDLSCRLNSLGWRHQRRCARWCPMWLGRIVPWTHSHCATGHTPPSAT
ncbi:hypothetical protein I553_3371 [Mycobacterium xenopi 4042]|uniref:Uncharacterized protein n=1 Tax=Mycobacterium xenopi 4042 TaxID=1299334 RepID=X8DD49_MYCXE|nr:hypothetical protein I553_3371 [Mycobacterium xenopi 4042]